jgi:hypothetical protein
VTGLVEGDLGQDAIAAHHAFVYNPTSFESDRLRGVGMSWSSGCWAVLDTASRFLKFVVSRQGMIIAALS